jgi:hypothetical protein
MKPGQPQANCGFAIADLLAVAAVLTLLAAIVAIPLTRSARASRLAHCLDNLGKVDRSILAFATDHQQALPAPVGGVPGELQWWYKEQVKSYAGLKGASSTNDVLFACPDDRGYTDPRPFHDSERFDYGSYVFNGVQLPGAGEVMSAELMPVES